MGSIYIALVDTPGIFASIIRYVLKQKYVHVVISMDARLEEAYSIGRRHPAIPFFAGFEKEDKKKILKKYPNAQYMVCRVKCTTEQKSYIKEVLREAMKHRFRYHYMIVGLPFILFNKPFKQKYHYTCSSYLAKIMDEAGICYWSKDVSLVTPKDFKENLEKEIIFEGLLYEFIRKTIVVNK